jgi:hypothetical protein
MYNPDQADQDRKFIYSLDQDRKWPCVFGIDVRALALYMFLVIGIQKICRDGFAKTFDQIKAKTVSVFQKDAVKSK